MRKKKSMYEDYEYVKMETIVRAVVHGDMDAVFIIVKRYVPYIKTCIVNKAKQKEIPVETLPLDDLMADVIADLLVDIRKFKLQ